MNKQWTSLAALVLALLFAGASDGLMDALGLGGFAVIGVSAMGIAYALVGVDA